MPNDDNGTTKKEGIEVNGSAGRGRKLALFLRADEVHRMFEKAEMYSQRDFKILMLLYHFGLRNTELTSINRSSIDIVGRTIKIVQGKGKKDRLVPIVELDPFEKQGKTILDYLAAWKGKDGSGLLIEGDSSDGSISDRTVRRIVKKYAILARVTCAESVHPHTLRHSYATHIYNAGVSLDVVQMLLGHSDLKTTQIYAHMGIDKLRKEINKAVRTIQYKRDLSAKLEAIEGMDDKIAQILEYQRLTSKGIAIILGA